MSRGDGPDERSFAVTARTNRCRGGKDPTDWSPPLAEARCTYPTDWVAAKLRWNLAVDGRERAALG